MSTRQEFLAPELAQACRSSTPDEGLAELIRSLGDAVSHLKFEHVLTRSGWHRLGGVVDSDYQRVAEGIATWAEGESGGDVEKLLSRYSEAGYFATRLQGRTHYLVAPTGHRPGDFVQLEVEELQEVLDRYLIDPDWLPESLEEFLDPLDYPRLEPEPIGLPRYLFRRMTDMTHLLRERQDPVLDCSKLCRFLSDWSESSAGSAGQPFCRHWVLALRETPDSDGGTHLSARPVPTSMGLASLAPYDGAHGLELANRVQGFDRQAGYPFAWYFHMLTGRLVPADLGEAVGADHDRDFGYLPSKDRDLLMAWRRSPYAF
jgi:hypothetical protein